MSNSNETMDRPMTSSLLIVEQRGLETGTLRQRDGALTNHWYIACLSFELKNKPIRRMLYERPYVLFRDEKGRPACLPDRCLHRAAQLSLGTCENGKLICPYHGWTYDANGDVVNIPSESMPADDHCGALRPGLGLSAIPCVEQDGCIWVWPGEGAPSTTSAPWRFPHFRDKAWVHYFMITDFKNEVTHLIENFMDVPHTVFVHRGWFRKRARKAVPITLDAANGRLLAIYHQPDDSIGFTSRILNPQNKPMEHTDCYIFPNLTRVDYRFGTARQFIINSQCTPVETLNTRVYTYIAYKMGSFSKFLFPFMRFYTRRVIEQDVDIMKNQGESFRQNSSQKFAATEADEMHLIIEQMRAYGIENDPKLADFSRHSERVFWI